MVSQPVVARLIVRFPIGRFVSIATILWGAVLMCVAASRSFAGLMAVRAILGCLESCINPAFIIISAQWWTREEQPLRITYWYLGNSIGQVCGGLLGYGIAHINSSNVPNWSWFFIIFGAITIFYGSFLFYYLPDSPMNARWLSDADRAMAVERVRSNRTGIENHVWKWSQFKETLLDVQCWILVATFFLDDIPAGGVGSFGSIVVKGFGYSSLYSTLLLVPLGVIQAICLLFGGFMTQKFQNIRTWLVAGMCSLGPFSTSTITAHTDALPESMSNPCSYWCRPSLHLTAVQSPRSPRVVLCCPDAWYCRYPDHVSRRQQLRGLHQEGYCICYDVRSLLCRLVNPFRSNKL